MGLRILDLRLSVVRSSVAPMSITSPPLVDHPVVAAACAVRVAVAPVAEPGEGELWQLSDTQLLDAYLQVQAAVSAVEALRLRVLAEVDRRRVTEHEYELSTPAWLRSTRAQSRRTATRDVMLAAALAGRFTTTAAELAAGRVSVEQVEAITRSLDDLPEDLDADQIGLAEATMLGYARQFDPSSLRTLSRHLLDVVAPEIAEEADAARLEREAREARRTRYLSLTPDGQGSLWLRGKLPIVDGEALRAVVEAIAAHDTSGVDDETGDRRPMDQRRADALVTIAGAYLADASAPSHGGDRPRVTVTLDYATLVDGVGSAYLIDSGQPITAGEARRLACDADILPVILGGASQPLDVGREQRLFTGGLRRAPHHPRRWLRVPRLRPPTTRLRSPPRHPLVGRWHHQSGQRCAALSSSPPRHRTRPPGRRAPAMATTHGRRRLPRHHPTRSPRPGTEAHAPPPTPFTTATVRVSAMGTRTAAAPKTKMAAGDGGGEGRAMSCPALAVTRRLPQR